ncbi:MAG TPA: two-component regulator propeller domain-containing protein [Cyclobacteriaceae bacterium]|jgi:signal transduction histidine kinase/CheY-like chemotaxis protein/ligand-binding sensor domain-containing protein|nr:two-component regulator propeller domain-containing protein [Cyclobacteriaceae bacterium]
MASVLLLLSLLHLSPEDTATAWPHQHVDKKAMLSNSAITSVYMDKYDYVWLGTWDGLDRYDGSSIKVYKPDPFVKGSISNNVIRKFLEDGDGNLWIVTHQGINKYDRQADSFHSYLDSLNDIPFQEYNIRACVGSDSMIWASLIGKGISRYSKQKDAFIKVAFEGIESRWLASVIDVGNDKGLFYMLGNDGKIICTLNNRMVFTRQVVNPSQLVFHKFLRIGQHYFISVATSTGQLYFYDLSDMGRTQDPIQLGRVTVTSLDESLDHTSVWVGTESGMIFKSTLINDRFETKSMDSYFPTFAKKGIKILTITETNQDLIWVATDGDGVYKFLTLPKMFYSISAGPLTNGQLSHSIIRSVFEDANGTLYIGTRGGGLNIIDRGKTKVLNTKSGLSNNAVLSLNKDQLGNVWVGLDGEGIDMIEARTNKIFHFPRDFENKSNLSFSSVYSICIDAFNDIWLGTSGYGVIHLKVKKTSNGKYRLTDSDQIQHSTDAEDISIRSNIVYAIVEERPNMLWIGTRGMGIYRYNALTKKIEDHVQADPNRKNRLCNNDVLSLYIDKREQLWIGTSGGLNRLSLASKPYRINNYTLHEGLPNNTIHGILEDAKSNIWISTNRGLTMYDQVKMNFKNFDNNDGLQNNEFTDGAFYQSKISERLFFGGIDGLDIAYPSKISSLNYFPRLTVKEFLVRNVVISPSGADGLLTNNIDFTNEINLNYDQNFISFSFTTLDYWNNQKCEYKYFLENFDKDWNSIGQQQSLSLTNIPPGHYKLNISYTNENGIWNSVPRTFSITISPPFWKTSWAYLLYALLALGAQIGFILYIRWRARNKKAIAIDRFKALQLKELNDYKLQFFTNIAHEFRTPLTLILGPVTSLLNKVKDADARNQLNTVLSNSLRLQKLIEELIQFRKIESGKDTLEISSTDLVPFTQQIVESFQGYAMERDIHLEFHPEPEFLSALVDAKKLEKILINLISNAIKYSSKEGIVNVILKHESQKAIFIIRDEGIGIAEENKHKIFESFYQNQSPLLDSNGLAKSTGIGLSLTKSLVMIHRGEIKVESKLGKGSTFSVSIPITREHYRDIQENASPILPALNLSEKISLEFEIDHYLADQPAKVASSVLSKHPSLLVVDDNTQITSLLENILSNKYSIHKAHNGKKALSILEEERIDLVISDILMPDMNGLELCKKIKENIQTSHIPVILLTAKVEIENRIEGLQVGADSYIPKPFHPEHLFIRIEKLIERMELIRGKFQNFAEIELSHLSPGISERDDSFFFKITQCIQKHLSEPEFNADDIGEEVGMSKASLYRKVKTITGLTPHGLIKQYRLKKAADLLKSSSMSVSEVIYETGFNSRSYFYKSFNEMFHCHPKDFNAQSTSHKE